MTMKIGREEQMAEVRRVALRKANADVESRSGEAAKRGDERRLPGLYEAASDSNRPPTNADPRPGMTQRQGAPVAAGTNGTNATEGPGEMGTTIVVGRQTRGKTTVIRRIWEVADAAGRPFPIINLETHKRGIERYIHTGVHTLPPTATSAAAMHAFLFETTAAIKATGAEHLIIDSNGEDERLLAMSRDYPIAEIFAELGVRAQLFFVGGADPEDLRFLKRIDETRAFESAVTILGFAQHSSQAPDPMAAYQAFASQPLIADLASRSAANRLVLIPACAELESVQHVVAPLHEIGRLGGAGAGAQTIAPWTRHRIGVFCRMLDEALEPLKGIIP